MNPKSDIDYAKKICIILLIFVIEDIALFGLLGVMFLDGKEYTGILMNGEPLENTKYIFSAFDYFKNCTIYCLLEDLIIIAIYKFSKSLPDSNLTITVSKTVDPSYFCLLHLCFKILINLNSTVMFLSDTIYARQADWKSYTSNDGELITNNFLSIPDVCNNFKDQHKSLFLGLGSVIIGFTIILCLLQTSDKVVKFLKSIGDKFIKILQKIIKSLQRNNNKTDLLKYSIAVNCMWLLLTGLWAVFVFITRKENKNSLLHMQYSAWVKFIIPAVVVLNSLLCKIDSEHKNDNIYIHHCSNDYSIRIIINMVISCITLMAFGEFGSIVCIVAMTIISVLLFFDFLNIKRDNNNKVIKGDLIISVIFTVILGVFFICGLLSAENIFFHALLLWVGESTDIGGEFLGLKSNSFIMYAINSAFIIIIFVFIGFIKSDSTKKSISASKLKLKKFLREKLSSVSVAFITIIMIGGIMHFNFFYNGFNDKTILKSFYMTAGRFNNEMEIPADVTTNRTRQVSIANEKSKKNNSEHTEIATEQKEADYNTLETIKGMIPESSEKNIIKAVCIEEEEFTKKELEKLYNTKVYELKIIRKVMVIIDRLCFSVKSNELISVNNGMKKNMGFDVAKTKNHNNYVASLQSKYYLSYDDVMNASEEIKSVYVDEDGNPRSYIKFLNIEGKEPEKENESLYVYALSDVKKSFSVRYDDNSTQTIENVPVRDYEIVFKSAVPTTASSDYALYTLSSLGVGNMLLFIFIPFFLILILIYNNFWSSYMECNTALDYIRYFLRGLAMIYITSFIIQAIVILFGVFGISIFTGLSFPLVASGNFEMLLNNICVAVMLCAIADPYKNALNTGD